MKTQTQRISLWVLCMLFICIHATAQSELYIAPNGNDTNTGTISNPLKTLIGARNKARTTGAKTIWIRGGRYFFDTSCNLDSQDSGLKISGYRNEKVIFDGAELINPNSFSKVSDGNTLNRLHNAAKNQVFASTITNQELITLLEKTTSQVSMEDRMMTVARFPNIGFGHINSNTINNAGEQIREFGNNTTAKGARFKLKESFNAGKWSAELKYNKRAVVTGYYSADWYKGTSRIFSVGTDGTIILMDGSRYGIKKRGESPNRMFAYQLLCELDEPGEWFYDTRSKKLFIWPIKPITENSKIGVWAGPELINITNASDIKIQNITIQNIGKGTNGDGAIDIRDSSSCEVAGVIFRYIAAPLTPVNIWNGKNCGIKSADFFDTERGLRCYGGTATANSITYGRNYVENCHFTQIYSKSFYGKAAGISGAGNIFKNNLIHNINGQPVTHAGPDHTIELNEAFNVGIEEGDGGAFYTGADIWSHGNKIRHNFVHHIMSIPKLLGRAAFFSDDYDGGELVSENVVYKGGWEALKMNKGGGHTVQKNVILECYRGIRNGDDKNNGEFYQKSMEYIQNGNPTANDKPNYIGRMLKAIGKAGWQNGLTVDNWYDRLDPFWLERYPNLKFTARSYQRTKRMNAYECRFYDNMFYGNETNILGGPTAAVRGSQDITLGLFVNPENLNFKFKEPRPSYAPNIPFEKIGLYKDGFRCAVPNKDTYRRNIKNRFNNQASHTNDSYDFNTINQRLYYNSGRMILDLIPCYNDGVSTADTNGITEFRYDLGTNSSPVFNEHTRMTNIDKPGTYFWTKIRDLKVADRGNLNGANNINRDFLFGERSSNTLVHQVDNGMWRVVITWGDAKDSRDKMRIIAEGITMDRDISTQAGQFKNSDFTIEVNDTRLNLDFIDDGGGNNRWSVTRIWLRKINSTPTNEAPIGKRISLQKSGGNQGYIAAEATNNRLIANRDRIGQWETFIVEEHPKGGIALKALSTDKYIQVQDRATNRALQPDGNNKLDWEQFEWKSLENDKVAIKSLHSGKWLQASWNDNNSLVTATNNTIGNWETFNWQEIAVNRQKPEENIKNNNILLYPNPTSRVLEVTYQENTATPFIFKIFDNLGREVYTIKSNTPSTAIDIEHLTSGIYYIKVQNRSGLLGQKSFIKE